MSKLNPENTKHTFALHAVGKQDCGALLRFELTNQTYFEQFVPPRPVGFLTGTGMATAIDALVAEMSSGQGAYYLLWQDGAIIGRYNFTIADEKVADLGYRLAQSQTGKGVATQGLAMALNMAKTTLNLSKVIAETTPDNPGSIRVMEKSGFVRTGTKQGVAELHGQRVDLIGFEWEK